MGPNNLCYVTVTFYFFPMAPCHFYNTLTSLSMFLRPRRISTTFKSGRVTLRFLPMWSPI